MNLHDAWQDGVLMLASGEYWEAHERWESIWIGLPVSAHREALQALIQFAAACHKVKQARAGRAESGMQRGMGILIESAKGHLGAAAPCPGPDFEVEALEEALDALSDVLTLWKAGEALMAVEARIEAIATALASRLSPGV